MNIPEEAIEAGALASKRNWYPAVTEPCDDHREDARAALEAALPHIVRSFERLVDETVFKVDSTHHFHGDRCLCGEPVSARARSQTEHITNAVVTELTARIAENGSVR